MKNKRIPQQSLFWLPSGKRKRGRPRETLCRSIIREGSIMVISKIKHLAMQCNAQIGELWFLPYVPSVVLEEPDT
jgi:hypothetical protein